MEKNIGISDRITRGVIAIGAMGAGVYYGIWWLCIIAGIIAITAVIGWCGLYKVLGVNTAKPCSCCCTTDESEVKLGSEELKQDSKVSEQKPAQVEPVVEQKSSSATTPVSKTIEVSAPMFTPVKTVTPTAKKKATKATKKAPTKVSAKKKVVAKKKKR